MRYSRTTSLNSQVRLRSSVSVPLLRTNPFLVPLSLLPLLAWPDRSSVALARYCRSNDFWKQYPSAVQSGREFAGVGSIFPFGENFASPVEPADRKSQSNPSSRFSAAPERSIRYRGSFNTAPSARIKQPE